MHIHDVLFCLFLWNMWIFICNVLNFICHITFQWLSCDRRCRHVHVQKLVADWRYLLPVLCVSVFCAFITLIHFLRVTDIGNAPARYIYSIIMIAILLSTICQSLFCSGKLGWLLVLGTTSLINKCR